MVIMRKDIQIHIATGDIVLSGQDTYKTRDFQWVSNPTGLSRYIYGEIAVPSNIPEATIRSNGLYATIPYTPIYKEFMVRIKRSYDNGTYEYLPNPIDGSFWFLVKVGLYGKKKENAYASQLLEISESDFYIQFDGGVVNLYAASESDVNIVKADRQNSNMLLSCVPTNNYRYPITGVGLIRWTNGNVGYGKLADRIKSEFADDGMTVNDASFDYETKQLSINATSNES